MNKKSKTMHYKAQKPRQTSYELNSQINKFKEDSQDNTDYDTTKRFSSQYLSLAKKFKIKMLNSSNSQKRGDYSVNRLSKGDKLRVNTQFSKSKMRYKPQSPINMLELRPHSQFINSKNIHKPTIKTNRLAMFNLNKNTVYSDNFIRLKTQPQKDKQEQQNLKLTVQEGDQMLINLGYHCKKLWEIKQSLSRQSLNSLQVIRQIKQYIMRQDRQSISKINYCFSSQKIGRQIKLLVLYERISLMGLIVNIASGHFYELLEESNRIVEIVLGFWYQVVNNTYCQNIYQLEINQDSEIKEVIDLLANAKLLTKRNLSLLLQTVTHKIGVIFKHHKILYKKFDQVRSFGREMSINRAFYQVLTIFANYLSEFQRRAKINLDNISFFATCPSPYLIKASKKPYSLVLDLDETLIYCSKQDKGKGKQDEVQQIWYRPGCNQFINDLSKYYQIIVFTTANEAYAKEVTAKMAGIDYLLYRQHAVRLKNGMVKDLSRLGRNLNKTVIVDDQSSNYRSNRDNGIKILSWKGDKMDMQLDRIKEFLLHLAQMECPDVKKEIPVFKQQQFKQSKFNILSSRKKQSQPVLLLQASKQEKEKAERRQKLVKEEIKQQQQRKESGNMQVNNQNNKKVTMNQQQKEKTENIQGKEQQKIQKE